MEIANPADTLGFVGEIFGYAISWFWFMLNESGLFGFYLSGFFVWSVYRFLLRPVFGGSDRVSSGAKAKAQEKSSSKEDS